MKRIDIVTFVISAIILALSICALFQCPSHVGAQDALILTPNGPVPMLNMPEAGAGAIPGGGLWVPMVSPPTHYGYGARPYDREWQYPRERKYWSVPPQSSGQDDDKHYIPEEDRYIPAACVKLRLLC